jgi:spore coat polysaccharide biosynthesis protein SpsF
METKIFIQARTGSTRLPRKVLLPFYENRNILELIVERLQLTTLKDDIIIVTTNKVEDSAIIQCAEKMGICWYKGEEHNVLLRFIEAAKYYKAKTIIRVCADNPFIQPDSIEQLLHEFKKMPSDYIGFLVNNNIPSIKSHFGLWAELTTLEALQKINILTNKKKYLEHVTNYLYEHPDIFNVAYIRVMNDVASRDNIRLTLDTESDFVIQKEIFKDLYSKNKLFSIHDILVYLENNPKIFDIMKQSMMFNKK